MKMLISFLMLATTCFAGSETLLSQQDNEIIQLKAALSEALELKLDELCGEQCPSHEITVLRSLAPKPSVAPGFSQNSDEKQPRKKAGIRSLRVSVWVSPGLSTEEQKDIEKMVRSFVRNQVPYPVRASVKPLTTEKKTATFADEFLKFQPLFWPVALLLFGLMFLVAGLLFYRFVGNTLRFYKDWLTEPLADEPKTEPEKEKPAIDFEPIKLGILQRQAEDLNWLAHRAAIENDQDTLALVANLFNTEELTQIIDQPETFQALSKVESRELDPHTALEQLKPLLQKAHWKRRYQQSRLLAELQDMTTESIHQFLATTDSAREKAIVIAELPKPRWAEFLTQFDAAIRAEIGCELSHLGESASVQERQTLQEKLTNFQYAPTPEYNELFSDYVQHLDFAEGQAISQKLNRPVVEDDGSFDRKLLKMSGQEILNLAMKLEFNELLGMRDLLGSTARAHLTQHLPRSLQARLSNHEGAVSEADKMKGRYSTAQILTGQL